MGGIYLEVSGAMDGRNAGAGGHGVVVCCV